jgi:hypothetical protein
MNTTVKPWITIDPAQFRRPVQERVGGTTVVSSTSPYAVPDAISAYDSRDNYILEAKYIGPDEPVSTFFADRIRMEIGKNSKRLVRIALPHDVTILNSDSFVAEIKKALQFAMDRTVGPKDNYQVVMAIVDGNKSRFAVPDADHFLLPELEPEK